MIEQLANDVIYPVLQLFCGQQISEVLRVPRYQNMLSGKNQCCDQHIRIPFAGSYLFYEANSNRLVAMGENSINRCFA